MSRRRGRASSEGAHTCQLGYLGGFEHAAGGVAEALTVEQVEAVARKAESDQEAALIRVAAYTGLRQGELRALRWRSVDFATATIHVKDNLPAHGEEKVPKSKVVRSVPLIDQAARALDEISRRGYLTAPDDRVFVSPTGGPLDDGDVRDGFYWALGEAGLGHLREQAGPIVFHDLRHTFGTLAVQVWPVTDVQAYMGHADIKTTMRYVHHVPKHDAAKRFSSGEPGASRLRSRKRCRGHRAGPPDPGTPQPFQSCLRVGRGHRRTSRDHVRP